MNFVVGQVFNKNGNMYCVLDLITYNLKNYVLFSVESGKQFYFDIFEINTSFDRYDLIKVNNQAIFNSVMEIFEMREKSNE